MHHANSINEKEQAIVPAVSNEAGNPPSEEVPLLDDKIVRKLRWKLDLIVLPLLCIMYTFK